MHQHKSLLRQLPHTHRGFFWGKPQVLKQRKVWRNNKTRTHWSSLLCSNCGDAAWTFSNARVTHVKRNNNSKHLSHTRTHKRSLQMNTCLNTYSHKHTHTHSPWKNLAYYPCCIIVMTFLSQQQPRPRCVRERETVNERGGTTVTTHFECLWVQSTRRHSFFNPLMEIFTQTEGGCVSERQTPHTITTRDDLKSFPH